MKYEFVHLFLLQNVDIALQIVYNMLQNVANGGERMTRQYLIDLRKSKNESQQEVADSIGISRQYYSFIESGERQKQMDITLATRLARHFSVDISFIVSREDALAN